MNPLIQIIQKYSSSEEETPHTSSQSLSVIQKVELIYKLVDIVAAFGDGPQICHEPHIVALL
jgi:hypothetical protein